MIGVSYVMLNVRGKVRFRQFECDSRVALISTIDSAPLMNKLIRKSGGLERYVLRMHTQTAVQFDSKSAGTARQRRHFAIFARTALDDDALLPELTNIIQSMEFVTKHNRSDFGDQPSMNSSAGIGGFATARIERRGRS
jgi:hypothetical protein